MGSEPLPALTVATLRAELEDSDLPCRVDLLEQRDLPAAWEQTLAEQSEPL